MHRSLPAPSQDKGGGLWLACDSQRKTLSHTMNMNQELKFIGAFPTERRAVLELGCSEKWARVTRASSKIDTSHRHPDVVSNEKGFPHFYEWMRVK